MQIVFHIGAHCTDEGQILSCLLKNRAQLAEEGIIIAHPGRFRAILRETMLVLNGERASPEVQEVMLDSILDEDRPERIIFSNDAFLCGIRKIFGPEQLYPEAEERVQKLYNLFPNEDVELCLAIRNPATFLPACFSKSDAPSFAQFLSQTNPQALRWSEVIQRIKMQLPTVPLRVWSNEDTPFIWHELLRDIADHDDNTRLKALDLFIASIMLPEGVERMAAYLQTRPPANETQRRRILSAFLDKFEKDDDAPEVEAPGWTDEYLAHLTDLYEQDLFQIERMPGVDFISP
jgi:hypothetical protein